MEMTRAPTSRGLQAFRMMMLSGSVSAAAAGLNLSQPAVSRLLKDLEEDTGLRLFDRVKGRLQPTDEACLLLDEVQRSFIGLERISATINDIRKGRRGTLTIAAMPALASTVLPHAISRFAERMPETAVTLQALPSLTVTQLVLTRECDLGFISAIVPTPGLHFERRYTVTCFCIMPAEHPLATHTEIQPTDLEGQAFVSLTPSTLIGMQIARVLEQCHVESLGRIETPFSNLVSLLVLAGAGVGIVDSITAAHHVRSGGVSLPFVPTIELEMGIVRPRETPLGDVQTKFIDIFDEFLKP